VISTASFAPVLHTFPAGASSFKLRPLAEACYRSLLFIRIFVIRRVATSIGLCQDQNFWAFAFAESNSVKAKAIVAINVDFFIV
jgi:hypothetical protein